MSVTLGKHGDYAVRAVIDLARHWGGDPRKSREIATSMDIPPDFLKRILAELVAQGLLTSTAGSKGGYQLTRPPEEISLLDVIEPSERLLAPDRCILKGGPCDWSSVCPIHDPWCLAQKAFAEVLDDADLAQIVSIDRDIEIDVHKPMNPGHTDSTPRRGIRL